MNHQKTSKQIENDLNALFKKYAIHEKVNAEQIKKWVWNAEGETVMEAVNRFNKKCLRLFPEPADLDEANRIVHVFMDAWNYFPHKALGGKSPNDRVQEAMKTMPAKEKNDGRMPKVIVGNTEMEWEEYQKMLREMEKVQKPFKKWIEQEMLPKYKKYLGQVVKNKRTRESTYDVAERFFDRTLHVGFVTLEDVRSDFIQHDFPHWWPTHILYSNLNPSQVKKSLQKLFAFLELAYGYDMEEYGFERKTETPKIANEKPTKNLLAQIRASEKEYKSRRHGLVNSRR